MTGQSEASSQSKSGFTHLYNLGIDEGKVKNPSNKKEENRRMNLEELLEKQKMEKLQRLESLHLDEMIESENIKLNELKRKNNGEIQAAAATDADSVTPNTKGEIKEDMPNIPPDIAEKIIGMEDESKQMRAVNVYRMMSQKSRGEGESMLLPLILSAMESRPDASNEALTKMTDRMLDIFLSNKEEKQSTDPGVIMDKAREMYAELARSKGDEKDPVEVATGMFRNLKAFEHELVGDRPAAGPNELQILEVKQAHDREMLKMERDYELKKEEFQLNRERTSTMRDAGAAFAKSIGEGLGAAQEVEGVREARREINTPGNIAGAQMKGFKCDDCGTPVVVDKPEVKGRVIKCPKEGCGAMYDWK